MTGAGAGGAGAAAVYGDSGSCFTCGVCAGDRGVSRCGVCAGGGVDGSDPEPVEPPFTDFRCPCS